ncbi:hypothetical protein [Streptomyces sp. KLOTTS4A1]|uniref:hypothetical protein n=1 Tax=Streptomyces sp. KLOTTS4A1 TaxID=3390996 RepID=UPI0039F4ADE7
MKRLILAAAVAALALPAAPASAAPSPSSAPALPTAARCIDVEVTGRTVAVRRPAGDAPVAKADSPIVRYVHRGDVLRTCVTAVDRTESGPAYRKCGKGGWTWYIVRGGQIPTTCARPV